MEKESDSENDLQKSSVNKSLLASVKQEKKDNVKLKGMLNFHFSLWDCFNCFEFVII